MATFSRRRATRSLLALPVIAGLAFSMSACSAPKRPTADELAKGLAQVWEDQGMGGMFTDEVNHCIADVLIASDVSDTALANAAKGKDLAKKDDLDTFVAVIASPEFMACAAKMQMQ